MGRKLAVCLLALACHGMWWADAGEPSGTEGLKGSAPSVADGPTAVPAASPWGMVVMVLLVLSASTAALLGGGDFWPRRVLQGAGRAEPTSPGPVLADTMPQPPAEPVRERSGSPKNKSRRAFSRQRQRQEPVRKGWNVVRRDQAPPGSRRRGGPGCRGVR
jgi:hypothetical protein